jgi:hypothetical protein
MCRRLARLVVVSFLALAALALPAPRGAAAEEAVGATDGVAIRSLIESQLAAFRRDDAEAAFAFASPGIRSLFRTAEAFMRMVRTAYPPVYRPREIEFRDLVEIDGRLTQRVLLVGPDGAVVVAHYFLQRQPDGSWRIDGCVLAATSDSAT